MANKPNPYALVGKAVKTYNLGAEGKAELWERLKERFGDNIYKYHVGQIINQAKMIREEMNITEASQGLTDSLESQIILDEVKKNSEPEIVIDIDW